MCAAHKENKAPDFFPLRNKLFMPNMKNGTILDTEKNEIDFGDSPVCKNLYFKGCCLNALKSRLLQIMVPNVKVEISSCSKSLVASWMGTGDFFDFPV